MKPSVLSRIANQYSNAEKVTKAIESQKVKRSDSTEPYVAPRTSTEEIVANIWAQVLHVEKVGIHDNFFSLGGHSLRGTQVVARARQSLGVELPLRVIFELPTVAALSEHIDQTRAKGTSTDLPPLITGARPANIPLSFAQQRMWFLDQLEPGNAAYSIPQMFRLRGPLNVDALQKSLSEIVRRHEVLRTSFITVENEPAQVITDDSSVPLPVTDLSHLDSESAENEVERLGTADSLRPFDLKSGRLLRAGLLRLNQDEHVLLLNVHHIAGDRWSMGILSDELAARYSAFAQDKASSSLPSLPLQYADYAIWQREWLTGGTLQNKIDYWKQHLDGAPALLELPTDRARPAIQSFRGATITRSISRELNEKVLSLSREHGVTQFITMLAAFQILLARYSRQEDVVVGSPVANRGHSEIEPLIGFFVNTLALRTDLSGNPTFLELLAHVREVCLNAYAHQEVPFEGLVEHLQPERSLSYNPIFQVLFALQNAPLQALELTGLALERMGIATSTSMFDLSCFVVERPEGIALRAEYSTDLFDESTISRFLGHYETLLRNVAENPKCAVAEIAILPHEERVQILETFNATAAAFDKSVLLHQFFEKQAEKTPSAIAVADGQQHISYAELNLRANQVAHFLLSQQTAPDSLVAICANRSIDLLVGILGILKAGAAYAPLDPAYPKERIQTILEDAHASILLTQQSLVASLPGGMKHFCIDSQWNEIALQPTGNPERNVSPEHLAYVLFTSGSTGRPKGVALEHGSASTFVQWANSVFTKEELSGVLLSTSVCFDLSIFEIFAPLSCGGKVILAENALYLPTIPARDEVTLINTVPSAIAELLRLNAVPASVKIINLAGEALAQSLVDQIYALPTVEKVYNLYGPTEDTTYSTYTLVPRDMPVTIGRPLANTQAYILDRSNNITPIGVPGELHLAGDGLARGYYGRPDLTSERFLVNTFRTGTRMYRTGDLCRWLPDGHIEYMGRIDHQVKVRGFRIELGELEAAFTRHKSVQECVAVVREDQPGNKQLVAYVVFKPGITASTDDLRTFVRQSLPEYMVPSAIVMLEALPLTPNRKIDRKALPAPDQEQLKNLDTYVAPRTPTEETLAAIWSEVLRVSPVGILDDFFDLGGHSLLATRVISRIRQAFQIEVPLRLLFEARIIASMSESIEQLRHADSGHVAMESVSRTHPLPLSFAQQRLWFLHQLEPENPFYNVLRIARLKGALNLPALQESVQDVVRRHEVLRTIVSEHHGEPAQRILPELDVPVSVINLTSSAPQEREADARRLVEGEVERPFNLAHGPLFRVTLLELDALDHVLVLNLHHSICDDWSLGLLWNELAECYQARCTGATPDLPALPVQYADFAAWQRRFLAGDTLQTQIEYWRKQLKNAPPSLDLPTDRPRPPAQTFHGASHSFTLPQHLQTSLQELCRREGVTLFMTLLAAFNVLLARYSGQNNIVVGSPIAGRNRTDLEKLIGFFVNTLVLRTDVSGAPTFRELLARVRETAMSAYSNQDLPFEKLVEELNPTRDLSRSPLFQVMLILQNAPGTETRLAGLDCAGFPVSAQTSKFDLTLAMMERPDGLRATFEYNTDLFDASTILRMERHWQQLLEAVALDANQSVTKLSFLPEDERQQLLTTWNDTVSDFPYCRVHQLVEFQASQHPDAPAVCFEGETISYETLNRRANRLAKHLQGLGVKRETLVGIYLHRSIDMLVAMLAVHKASGAYVPLDPGYPADRIAYMLEDSELQVLVTQQDLLSSLPARNAALVQVDADVNVIASYSDDNLPLDSATPEDLAYVRYTSGSTGKPKGVMIPHRAVANFLESMRRAPGIGPADTLLAVTTLSFDISELELWLPLCVGARVVIATREAASDGTLLAKLIADVKATLMQATPASWRLLLDSGWKGTPDLKILCGGEALSASLAEELLPCCRELWNMYGPTETTIWSAVQRLAPGKSVSLGRPIANTQFYVVDANQQIVPIGVPGELYIGGTGLACGYLKRPELTQEKFVQHQFSSASERLYRTGDLVRYRTDGELEFLGRIDHQVKIRGFRIELGEIEAQIGQYPGVRQAVVTVREDKPGDKRLVGYIGPEPENISTEQLRSFLKTRLPDYMVPAVFVQLNELPLSPAGKVDRKALPMPDYDQPQRGTLQASTLSEQLLASIWCEVLGLPHVGIDDDFFDLGGHSLLITQVASRIRQTLKVEIPLRVLFEYPVLRQLTQAIDKLRREEHGLHRPSLLSVARNANLPLSFAQQRLWFLDQMEPDNPFYNISQGLRLHGQLHVPALYRAIHEIVRRHEVLRTTFATIDDHAVQVIAPSLEIDLPLVDMRGLAENERETEVLRLLREESHQPINLARGAVIRVKLLQIADDSHVLLLTIHHIASDGWSMGIFVRELGALYEAFLDERPSPLPELALQYADYAVWQRKWLQDEVLEHHLSYWRKQLLDVPRLLELHTDHPRPEIQGFRGAVHRAALPQDLVDSLRTFGKQEGVTLFMTLFAAYQMLLWHHSDRHDFIVGTDLANRNSIETEAMIGFFVNVLPLRANLGEEPTLREILRRSRETTLGAYTYQDTPLENIVEELQPERTLSHNPLIQVLLVLQNLPPANFTVPGLTLTTFGILETAKFDLAMFMGETPDGIRLMLQYNPDLFEPSTIERMVAQYELLLSSFSGMREAKLAEFRDILDRHQRERLELEQKEFEQASMNKLKNIRRRAAVQPTN